MYRKWMVNNGMTKFDINIKLSNLYENLLKERFKIAIHLECNRTPLNIPITAIATRIYDCIERCRKYIRIGMNNVINPYATNPSIYFKRFRKEAIIIFGFVRRIDNYKSEIIDVDQFYDSIVNYLSERR